MKKTIHFLLIISISIILFGCNKNNSEYIETQNDLSIAFQAYDEGNLKITYGDNTIEETDSLFWPVEKDMKIKDIVKEWNIISIEAICNDDIFEGWIEFKEENIINENGFTEYTSKRTSKDKVYTTDEILEMTTKNYNARYYAKCKKISLEEYDILYGN